jgi:hypothetical protein
VHLLKGCECFLLRFLIPGCALDVGETVPGHLVVRPQSGRMVKQGYGQFRFLDFHINATQAYHGFFKVGIKLQRLLELLARFLQISKLRMNGR